MIKLYNTLTNQKEEFHSQEKGKIKMYNCGPTVYDYAHIGNMNAFLVADILRRYLEYKGYEVRQIMNITDVGHLTADDINQADTGEDKMLKAALREKKTPAEIAEYYTQVFFYDIDKLNIKRAAYYPRATAHIGQMIKIIEKLIQNGLAYEANGNVFFDVEKFEGYGKLSKKKIDELKVGARLEEHPDKKNQWDFALWLRAPQKHLLKWESPWSVGYPGWHIECSAMSMEYLGETLDIHTGGEDHIFPHHENELAQSEGATGKPLAVCWLHNRFLLVDGQKMSKSKGNYYILKDIADRGYDLMAFRLLVLSSHYRSNLNFTWRAMSQAESNLEKIENFAENLKRFQAEPFKDIDDRCADINSYIERFEKTMDDDLNTPKALSVLYEMISKTNATIAEGKMDSAEAKKISQAWEKMNKVFGLKIKSKRDGIPLDIKELGRKRLAERIKQNFKEADLIREEIEKAGYLVEDLKDNNYSIKKK
ncbi:MAG: cysteinyl-tRNA synthetase [Patescibacteria group bacterium]|nr:cysteinyl-tRNA synthetase [Patescibacteria group bacterium]